MDTHSTGGIISALSALGMRYNMSKGFENKGFRVGGDLTINSSPYLKCVDKK